MGWQRSFDLLPHISGLLLCTLAIFYQSASLVSVSNWLHVTRAPCNLSADGR